MIRPVTAGEPLDLSCLPAPFPGWARHGEAARRSALWERWGSKRWEKMVAWGDPPLLLAGRRPGEGESDLRFWAGPHTSPEAAEAAVDAVVGEGAWWAGFPAASTAIADAVMARGRDGGLVVEALLDLADAPLGDEMSSTVEPLAPDRLGPALDLMRRVGARTRWARVGDPAAADRLEKVLAGLAGSERPPLCAWRGERLAGLAHFEPWSRSLGVWKVTVSAVESGVPVLPVLHDLLGAWEGRVGARVDAVRLSLPAEAEARVSRVARAGPASLWLRRTARGGED